MKKEPKTYGFGFLFHIQINPAASYARRSARPHEVSFAHKCCGSLPWKIGIFQPLHCSFVAMPFFMHVII